MKRELPPGVIYGSLALAVVVVAVFAWIAYGGGGPEARGAEQFMAVSHRLSLARGDVSKLDAADQEYIKSHPSGFRGSSGGPGAGAERGRVNSVP